MAKGGGSIMGFVISNGRGVESLSYYSKVSCGMTLAKSEYLVLNAYSNFHLFHQFFEHSNKVRCNKKSFSAIFGHLKMMMKVTNI